MLQYKDQWYCLLPLTVIQYADYSDIEKKVVNYENMMLDLDKSGLFKPFIQ